MTRRSRIQEMRQAIAHHIADLKATSPSAAAVTLHVRFHATEDDPDGQFRAGDCVETCAITIPARRTCEIPTKTEDGAEKKTANKTAVKSAVADATDPDPMRQDGLPAKSVHRRLADSAPEARDSSDGRSATPCGRMETLRFPKVEGAR